MSQPQIPVFDVRVEQEDIDAVADVLRSGWLTMGPRTEEFEAAFAEHLGSRHVLALSSCTSALHLACLAAGVKPGDEVIVPSMTFVATSNAVRYCGARPVFADIVGERDFGIDVDHVESLIGERTSAVIPVHYAGYPVDIERLVDLCRDRGLALIEDAAHAPDAALPDGRMLGTFALAGCFSFFPNKVLGVGEGGALSTDSDEVADRVRRLRSHGMTASTRDRHLGRAIEYDVVELGFNYRFDDPRAALLLSRFRRLPREIARRRELVKRYIGLLADIDRLQTPYDADIVDHSSCYLMGVLIDPALRSEMRRVLMEEHGVQTTVYPAVHRLQSYTSTFGEVSLPRTEGVADSLFSIPLFPHMTDEQQDRVVAALRDSMSTVAGGGSR